MHKDLLPELPYLTKKELCYSHRQTTSLAREVFSQGVTDLEHWEIPPPKVCKQASSEVSIL